MARSLWGDIEYEILAVILSFLSLPDIKNCCLVCKNWYKYLCDENNEIWHAIVTKKLGKAILASDLLVDVPTFKGKLRASFYTWNSNDSSRNINIKNCGFTIRRTPIAQSTDVAKCKIGFYSGRHCWEIWWSGPLGTVAIVGIATKVAAVQCSGYVPLLGIDRESWGWNIVDNILVHDGENIGNYPYFSNSLKCQTGERLKVILDCEDRTLAFEKNYQFLGIAFHDLPNTSLYPAVATVYGNTEVSLVYLGLPIDG